MNVYKILIPMLIFIGSMENGYCNEEDDNQFAEYSVLAGKMLSNKRHHDYLGMTKLLEDITNRPTFEIERKDGETNPLHLSAIDGLNDTVAFLLKKGMNPFIASTTGMIPIELAMKFNDAHAHPGYQKSSELLHFKMAFILGEYNQGAWMVLGEIKKNTDRKREISIFKKLYAMKKIGTELEEFYKQCANSDFNKFLDLLLL